MITFTLFDIVQIGLLIAACWACYHAGIEKGAMSVIEMLEEEGVLQIKDGDE